MAKLIQFTLFFVLTTLVITDKSNAQFTSTLGTSSLTGLRYDCITYPKGEDIALVDKKGKTRKVSKKNATNKLKDLNKSTQKRINTLTKTLNEKRKRLAKLLDSPIIALPKGEKELEKLKQEIPKLEALIESTKAQKTEITFLLAAVSNCGKEPPPLVGSNTIVTYAITLPKSGDQAYGIHAVHAFAVPLGVPDRICVSVDDGPYYETGIKYSVGTTFYDGSGTSNPVSHSEPAPAGVGYLPIFGQAGLFRHGKYDEDLAEVQAQLGKVYRLFIPSAKRSCPRA